jgi:hypothetical protein
LKKSKVLTAKKKSARPTKAKKVAGSAKSVVKAPVKMPVDTFDAWVAKQVRAERRESAPAKAEEPAVLPKDTFEIWIEKQKPRESAQPKASAAVPDTYDLWMAKQVALKSSEEAKPVQLPLTETVAATTTA